MSVGVFFCQAHRIPATDFCLCTQVLMYLCPSCLPKHKDDPSHDVFPMANLRVFRALGNDKAELVRRAEIVKKCNDFLDNASAREAAVLTEANNLMTELVQCYQELLDKNHRCFTNLVEVLREEVALLLMARETALSPLSQILIDRSNSLSGEEENYLCSIPEEESLKEIVQHCNQALAKAKKVQQQEYETEVQETFMKPSQGVKVEVQSPGQRIKEEASSPTHRTITPAVGDVQKLIAVLEYQVQCYDVASSQWQHYLALRQNIQVDYTTSSIFIATNRIFVCGGGYPIGCIRHVDSSAYLLEGDGRVQELPHMSTGRIAPGLAWDSIRQALYVFGGSLNRGTGYTAPLRTSEMFLSKWSPLPDMYQSRSYFNPCWHSYILYLCGGVTESVETYDPRSNTFTLQNFILPEDSSTTAVVESGTITVISLHSISKLQQGRLTSQMHGYYGPWSSCTPIVSGGMVYVVDLYENCCRGIDLTTGTMENEVRLS